MATSHSFVTLFITFCLTGLEAVVATESNVDDCMLDIRNNSYGLMELRIQCEDMHFLEVQAPSFGEDFLFYRISTNGDIIINEYFASKDQLFECKIDDNRTAIKEFIASFDIAPETAVNQASRRNFSEEGIENQASDFFFHGEQPAQILDISFRESQCTEFQAERYQAILKENKALKFNAENEVGKKETTIQEKKLDESKRTNSKLDRLKKIRKKRFFFIPGTKWCGAGNTADHYDDLGSARATDLCCRTHDQCPMKILGFRKKYNTFNWNPIAISHINCDNAFYQCLKRDGSGTSNLTGYIFFNLLGVPSFRLGTERYCVKYRWFSCVQHGYRQKAFTVSARYY